MGWKFTFTWEISDNADWQQTITVQMPNGDPVVLTGSTFRMDIKSSANDTNYVATLTTANGGVASTDLANGTITFDISKATIAVGTYVADCLRFNGSVTEPFATGSIIVKKGVTQT